MAEQREAAAKRALEAEAAEATKAPTPREGWASGHAPETLQMGKAPGDYSLSQAGLGKATINWGDGEQKVRVGDRLDRYPGHEVTDLRRIPRDSDPRLSDWGIEVTPPYDSGQKPYYIKAGTPSAEGEPEAAPLDRYGANNTMGALSRDRLDDEYAKYMPSRMLQRKLQNGALWGDYQTMQELAQGDGALDTFEPPTDETQGKLLQQGSVLDTSELVRKLLAQHNGEE